MYETIHYEVRDRVAWLTLNRPDKLNALTEQMNKEITKALKQAANDENVRCLVITGAGRAFCSGEDLGGVTEEMDHGEVLRTRYAPMMQTLYHVEKPVVAAVNGVAAGAGMSLALACDFRLVSEKASFVEAFIHVGLIPDAGNLYYLPRLIGHAKALELAVFGEKISAPKAAELGLATAVVPEQSWEEEVQRFAGRLANMPTKAVGLIKRYLRESWHCTFEDYLEKEAYGQRIAGLTEDHREGIRAFFEKRPPSFQGK
ncbi:enoyl-CoA hydratase-related protein [Parageobacillus thermoglucosidasius]|uniref:2-(1,2-epoxy-1,2-dihydrophenyl)acetyl-CoA isomerase n=2 Tax=Anoxybacillaceae TaxID=3120669 RepID=A0AAN0YTL1_PARTM|nr:enoyl-CoA hydratase-related protein [Parageobacillus thermoglucosidasius]KYD15975.1 Enoyl-CoA hydratase [Anoxybacillus flavithermus]REK58227.1 MAG: 2-(1,2-epoxy-1,2-dihydrophenyl)acetyl-CoA isomerase [Geobacillus sp.]ALF11202.1 enoyl-CoA hydratase [Parageobacillus thermoglucosidasius]ANZ31278.1 2-(1,2-epoxy-1,2-dihydrophenyl)acetyl-CoA isomerase [Parageobacillus thermoglucosidasius]APM82016.1 2-(1,2-epoxy-1,2-dihydrophenyl)acetyl-CoA isomerase [Parageobacillus thermoglucosidasius]